MSVDKKNSNFWATLDLLVGREWRKTGRETSDEVDEWVNSVVKRQEKQIPYSKTLSKKLSKSSASTDTASETMAKNIILNNQINADQTASSSGYSSWNEFNSDTLYANQLDVAGGNVTRRSTPNTEDNFAERPVSASSSVHGPKFVNFDFKIRESNVRARLEHLMKSNLVRMSNRKYMQELQDKIREDFIKTMNKRINRRVANEVERQKHLILTGLIPFSEAPAELWLHPVLVIDRYTNAIIAANRERKKKIPNIITPDHEYNDPEPIPSTDLTISAGHHYNPENKTLLCDNHLTTQEADDVANGYTFTDEDFYKLFYVNPQIIAMKELDTIEELYDKAEQILGPLKGLAPP